jgi:hypothetical protein
VTGLRVLAATCRDCEHGHDYDRSACANLLWQYLDHVADLARSYMFFSEPWNSVCAASSSWPLSVDRIL